MERGADTVFSVLLLFLAVIKVAQAVAVLQPITGLQPPNGRPPRTTRATFDFWGTLKMDCGVSIWGPWGPTNSNGYRNRTRTIIRHPQNGGARCPSLTETDFGPCFKTLAPCPRSRVYRQKRQSGTSKPRDFLFILDMSGSISNAEYTLQKDNLAKLIGKLCGTIGPGPTNNRAAVITYSTDPVANFDFRDYLNLAALQAAVRNLPKLCGSRCTGKAMDLVKTTFYINSYNCQNIEIVCF